jgi:RNA polymerase sigma-70 factor (ECF subfamily)
VDLLEFCREHAAEIDVLADSKALFLLLLIAELGHTSREALSSHLGWSGEIIEPLWRTLSGAYLVRDESPFGQENPIRLSTHGIFFLEALGLPEPQRSLLDRIVSEMAWSSSTLGANAIGLYRAGKSSLLNTLLGVDALREEPDTALLMRASEGDREAAESIFRTFRPILYRLCLAILHNPADAEDAVQQTFLKAFTRHYLPDERPVGPLLRTIAHNASLDILRRKRRYASLDELVHEDPVSLSTESPDDAEWADVRRSRLDLMAQPQLTPEEQAMNAELLRVAFARLQDRERSVLALWLSGMTIVETAEIMGIAPDHASRIRYHALDRLRKFAANDKSENRS